MRFLTGSVHSLVTRMRSGDIEMNPGPETQQQTDDTPARRTRQATLTNQGQPVQNQNVSLNDIMI